MMRLSGARGNMSKAIKAIEEVCSTIEDKLGNWKTNPCQFHDDIVSHGKLLENKVRRLKEYASHLEEATDKLKDTSNEELAKQQQYVNLYVEALDRATNLVDILAIEDEKAERSRPIEEQAQTPTGQIVNQQQHYWLETPKLPKFSGEPWQFENFWAMFEEIVEKTNQSRLLKFNALINCLEGEPRELIKKFRVSEENYAKAVEFLHKKYNNKDKIVAQLTEKLMEENVKNATNKEQRRVLDQIVIITQQLQDHDENIEHRMIKNEIVKKFSPYVKKEILKKKVDCAPEEWTINKLLGELEKIIARSEEMAEAMKEIDPEGKEKLEKSTKFDRNEQRFSKSSFLGKEKLGNPTNCIYCKQDGHFGRNCKTISTWNDRMKILKDENRCIQCFRQNHKTIECSARACGTCNKRGHHFSLCKLRDSNETSTSSQKKEQSSKPTRTIAIIKQSLTNNDDVVTETFSKETIKKTTATTIHPKDPVTTIPTLSAKAFNPKSHSWENLCIMMDTGADQSYITRKVTQKWNLPQLESQKFKIRTFSEEESKTREFIRTEVKLQSKNNEIVIRPFVTDTLVGKIRKARIPEKDLQFALLEHLDINPDAFQDKVEPDMIVGCDYIPLLWTGTHAKLPSGLILMDTPFGYTTMGQTSQTTEEKKEKSMGHSYQFAIVNNKKSQRDIEEEQRKDTSMKSKEEFSGPLKEELSEINQKVYDWIISTIEKTDEGYQVRLPFKENHPFLPDNYNTSFKRLQSVVRRHHMDILKMIDEVFKTYKKEKIIERVTPGMSKGLIHYNPHDPVLTPHKVTTKLREVIDGSSSSKDTPSLNDILHQGPVILPDIVDILIRFRAGTSVLVSDVEKAFLQVRLHPDDRNVTRLLWLKDYTKPVTKENIEVYRFTRVIFGLNVSPCLLAVTIIHHLGTLENQKLAEEIKNNLYVDNLLVTTDGTTEQVNQLYKTIKKIFNDMNMNIREFRSNDQEFNYSVATTDISKEEDMKILGVLWSSSTDTLHMTVEFEKKNNNSRRTVSSVISGIYDPLGLLVPLMLQLKLFQRELWNEEYNWDTQLNENHEKQWQSLLQNVIDFHVQLPRNVVEKSQVNTIVTFTDASCEATACCIYVKNSLGVHLLLGKSKVKPIKEKWTIPKLETQAITMGVNKSEEIVQALQTAKIKVDKVIILTDSAIALAWIKGYPGKKETGTLITNRLNTIRNTAKRIEQLQVDVKFGHVKTEDNPADLGTRGVTKEAYDTSIWLHGPKILTQNSTTWSQEFQLFNLEEKINKVICAATAGEQKTETVFDCSSTNKYSKMIRIVAWTRKFIKMVSKKFSEKSEKILENKFPEWRSISELPEIESEELVVAEKTLIRDQQKLIEPKDLKKWSNLQLRTSKDLLIVCEGRLHNADMETEAKFPILVDPNSNLAKQLILNAHGKFHQGEGHTIDQVRRRFWIPRLRQKTKSVLKKCVFCQRINKQPIRYPDMGPIPPARVTQSRPFERTGVDYFGPLKYRISQKETGTAFGVLFTCATTRLTHLELAHDYSTTTFIQAIRRFIAMRGKPEQMISDNAPAHILGKTIINEALKTTDLHDDIKNFLTIQTIKWTFITPYSPWKGGFYERLVKIAKESLIKSNRRNRLSYEELQTVFTEIAASMNSRPLTHNGDDICDSPPIRPSDFIYAPMPVTIPLDGNMESIDQYLPSKEKQQEDTKNSTIRALNGSIEASKEVWKMWSTHYLVQLREHHRMRMNKKRGTNHIPRLGQIVLLCDEIQPRNYWKLGKIIEVITSKDEKIREVIVKTTSGDNKITELRKSPNHIVPLELDQGNEIDAVSNVLEGKKETIAVSEKTNQQEQVNKYNLRKLRKVNYNENEQESAESTAQAVTSSKSSKWTKLVMLTIVATPFSPALNRHQALEPSKEWLPNETRISSNSRESVATSMKDCGESRSRFVSLSIRECNFLNLNTIGFPIAIATAFYYDTIKILVTNAVKKNLNLNLWAKQNPKFPPREGSRASTSLILFIAEMSEPTRKQLLESMEKTLKLLMEKEKEKIQIEIREKFSIGLVDPFKSTMKELEQRTQLLKEEVMECQKLEKQAQENKERAYAAYRDAIGHAKTQKIEFSLSLREHDKLNQEVEELNRKTKLEEAKLKDAELRKLRKTEEWKLVDKWLQESKNEEAYSGKRPNQTFEEQSLEEWEDSQIKPKYQETFTAKDKTANTKEVRPGVECHRDQTVNSTRIRQENQGKRKMAERIEFCGTTREKNRRTEEFGRGRDPKKFRTLASKGVSDQNYNCAFCHGGHMSNTCHEYPQPFMRRRQAETHHLCKICLAENTEEHQCKRRICFYCHSQQHHSAFCYEPETVTAEGVILPWIK